MPPARMWMRTGDGLRRANVGSSHRGFVRYDGVLHEVDMYTRESPGEPAATISRVGNTPDGQNSAAQGATSVSVDYPAGSVAAGRKALLIAVVRPSSHTFQSVSGWSHVVTHDGGTGTFANGTGTAKLGIWSRTLDGSETGSVTVSRVAGALMGTSMAGAMAVFSSSSGSFATDVFVTGDDSTHDADPSATFAAWASTLQANDTVVLVHGLNTNSTSTKSSFALSQSGGTFSTVNYRSNSLSSTGNTSGIVVCDATVITGSSNAATFSYSFATSSAGPMAAIRLRPA